MIQAAGSDRQAYQLDSRDVLREVEGKPREAEKAQRRNDKKPRRIAPSGALHFRSSPRVAADAEACGRRY